MAYRKTEHVEARLADKRKRILAATARALVGEGGWPEAQVSHVAAAAGLATGTVYRCFPSKADLFVEVLSAPSRSARWTCCRPSPTPTSRRASACTRR